VKNHSLQGGEDVFDWNAARESFVAKANEARRMLLTILTLGALAGPTFAQAQIIVDTGAPSGSATTSGNNWRAGRFTVESPVVVTAVEKFASVSSAGTVTVALRADDAGLPGDELFATEAALSQNTVFNWQGVSGLNWSVPAGAYWVTFERRSGQTAQFASLVGLDATTNPPNPLAAEALVSGGSGPWVAAGAKTGWRVFGSLQTSGPALVVDDGECNFRPVADNSPSRGSVWASMAQSFTAPYPRISFGFRLREDVVLGIPQGGQPVIYNLYHGEISPLTLLASRTVQFPASTLGLGSCRAGDAGFVEADFSGVELTVGEKYTVEVTVPTGDLPTFESYTGVDVWTSLANPYSSGRFYFPVIAANPVSINNGFFSQQDMLFRIGSAEQSTETLISDLLDQVTGVGPGASLADKMAIVQAYYAAGDAAAACAELIAFENQVKAQTGKRLTVAHAPALLADAQAIGVTMGCQ
jgi:hypothetical protein